MQMDGEEGSSQPTKPPPKKVGFKGRRAKRKFTRNQRTGSEQKGCLSRRRYHEYKVARAAAIAAAAPPPAMDRAVASSTSRVAVSSPTKKEFKAALRRYVTDLRAVTSANETQQRRNSSLKRKLEEKNETIKAATRQNSLHKAALKKSSKEISRVKSALHREMAFRVEDAERAQATAAAAEAAFEKERAAAEAAFEKERLEFQTKFKAQQQQFELYLKEAVSEAKVCLIVVIVLFI